MAKEAGGYGRCTKKSDEGAIPVFKDTADEAYQKIFAMCVAGKEYLESGRRFDKPEFTPSPEYIREMKRYGILTEDTPADAVIDPYATDRAYWESLWWKPMARNESASVVSEVPPN